MTAHLTAQALAARSRPAGSPVIPFADGLGLVPGRVHELTGPARRSHALALAANLTGPVIWIAPDWSRSALHPCGYRVWVDPGRLVHVAPRRPEDVLWCMEEALRSGAAPLVVADMTAPPALTPVRRLHLAAETGAGAAEAPPLGLLLTPEGAAPGIETRWSLSPTHEADRDVWRLERLRARTAPQAAWTMTGPLGSGQVAAA